MSRATVCFSMYSDMSIRIMLASSSKSVVANARASSVFPTPVGPRNKNDPIGLLGSLMPDLARRTRVRDGGHGLLLPDDPLMQQFFQFKQFLGLAFHQPGNRYPGPAADNCRNIVFIDFLLEEAAFTLLFPSCSCSIVNSRSRRGTSS